MDESVKRILDLLPQLVGSTDSSLRCRYANHAYAEFLGRSAESMVGVGVAELWGEKLFKEIKPYLERVKAGESVSFSKRIKRSNGETRFGKVELLPEPDGGYFVLIRELDTVERHMKDRDRLIHELDHRVNNTLQILESVLALESQSAEPRNSAVLDSIKARVDALALSYELLRSGEPIGGWPASAVLERIVNSIGPGISASYSCEPNLKIVNESIEPFVFIAMEIARWAAADGHIVTLEVKSVPEGIELAAENDAGDDLTAKAGAAGISLVESFARRCGAGIMRGGKRLSVIFPPEACEDPQSAD